MYYYIYILFEIKVFSMATIKGRNV